MFYFLFITKQWNYKAHPVDFDRIPKLIIINNNAKNQLQNFIPCQMMEALGILKGRYVGIENIQTDVFAFSTKNMN